MGLKNCSLQDGNHFVLKYSLIAASKVITEHNTDLSI